MKKDRRFPGKLNTARMALSFLMALALFVHAPLEVRAGVHSGGVKLIPVNSSYAIILNAAANLNGTSSYGSYEGDFTLFFDLSSSSPYISGLIVLPIDVRISGKISSYNVSVASTTLPPEFTVSPLGPMSGTTAVVGPASFSFRLYLKTEQYYIHQNMYGSVTFHITATVIPGTASLPAATHGSMNVGKNILYYMTTYDSLADMPSSPLGSIYSAIGLCSSYISNVFTAVQNNTSSTATWLQTLVNHVDANHNALVRNDNANTTKVTDKIQAQINNDNTNRDKIISALNANSKAEIADADRNAASIISTLDANHKAQTENDDKNADDIMNSYDKSDQDSDNKRFEDSRKELQEQEDSLFSSAMEGFGSLDMSDYSLGRFSAMQGAFSFVSGFIQSCYVKMGDFGAVVTVGLVLLIATKVIGLFRFQVVEH